MLSTEQNLRLQKTVTYVTVFLFLVKLAAWYLTKSVAILTDALESTVNVISGFIGIYSLSISARPRDENHPYGHGKVEFISAAIEGTLIIVAGLAIIYHAVLNFLYPHPLARLDFGIILISVTAFINYVLGLITVRQGMKNNSLALIASGRHLQSDTYSTCGIVIGLIVINYTKLLWIDSVVALLLAGIIIYTGIKILRSSIAGIMDEADEELLKKLVVSLNENRYVNWIDLHNLRIIKYGSVLHMDCHLTVPWYFNVHEAHKEVDALNQLIIDRFGDRIELFVHMDGCLDFSCRICNKTDCAVRKHAFEKKITWTVENISHNHKHAI